MPMLGLYAVFALANRLPRYPRPLPLLSAVCAMRGGRPFLINEFRAGIRPNAYTLPVSIIRRAPWPFPLPFRPLRPPP